MMKPHVDTPRLVLVSIVLLLAICALGATSCCMEKWHEKDVTVNIDQVPAAVKATIEKEANGAKTEEIEKEMQDGKEVYSVDIVADGKKTEVKMDARGKVIAREAE